MQRQPQTTRTKDGLPAMPCQTLQLGCAGVLDTWDNLYSFFLERVRNKLHVCLCFSPVGVKFSRRAQQFPGLINGCTIDWFLSWPEEALTSVSGKFIDEFSMACPDTVKDSLKLMMGAVHVNVTAACQVRRLPPGVLVTLLYGSRWNTLHISALWLQSHVLSLHSAVPLLLCMLDVTVMQQLLGRAAHPQDGRSSCCAIQALCTTAHVVADLPPPGALQEYFEKFRRHVYVTPKSYLSFISGYKGLYQKKLVFVQELARSINSGLAKMGDAKVDVNKMKVRRRSCNCCGCCLACQRDTHTCISLLTCYNSSSSSYDKIHRI